MGKEKATARIENWALANGMVFGEIYEDSRKRWPDGQEIRTSMVDEGETVKEGHIVKTRNSSYLLGSPARNS